MEAHTIEKTLNVLEREFRSLGLGQDLFRLAKCCEVDVDNKVQYSSALRKSKANDSDAVEDLIFQLIRWLDGQDAQADAETRYSEFMNTDGNDADDPEAFERFFEEKMGGDECHVIQLLKSCTQAALAPCNIELKMLLTKSNLTKEVPNSWRVDISFEDDLIHVKSRKQEQCVKNHFRYEWEVRFEYDADTMKCNKVDCSVVDLMFHKICHDGKEKSKKVVIKNLISTHTTQEVLDASEHRNWVYNPKRAGARSSGQPSERQLKAVYDAEKKPDLLASFLSDVADEKNNYSPALAKAASHPDDSASSDSDDAPKKTKAKKGVSIAPAAAGGKDDDDEKQKREEAEKRRKQKEEEEKRQKQKEKEEEEKRQKEEEEKQKRQKEKEEEEKRQKQKEEAEKRAQEAARQEAAKAQKAEEEKKERARKEEAEAKARKELEESVKRQREADELKLKKEAEEKTKKQKEAEEEAARARKAEEKKERARKEEEERKRREEEESEKRQREEEERIHKEKERKKAEEEATKARKTEEKKKEQEQKEKEEKERKAKDEKERREREEKEKKAKEDEKAVQAKPAALQLPSTDSSSALLSDRPPSKTSLITPRRERLKGSDSSSPKSSAQQLIENEPAKFRAAVEAKERERQAKDAGDAEMPLIEYENGDTYQGELNAQGERHGRGVYTNNRGDVYSGEYKNGKKHGKGVFSRADGSRYEGQFKTGLFNGYGVYVYENGDIYAGMFVNDEFNGQGRWSSVKKDFYEGQFEAGKRHGTGVYSYGNGAKYDGEWKEGLFHGRGTYIFQNKDKYIGEFVTGKFHGKGKYISANGKIAEGEFVNGKLKPK